MEVDRCGHPDLDPLEMRRSFAVLLLAFASLNVASGSDASAYCPESHQPMEVYRCKCYRFVLTEMYWPNAQKDCEENSGQLVQVTDASMSSWLSKQLDRKFYLKNGAWIGLSYNQSINDWTWPSGLNLTAAGYSNWADKEPDRKGLFNIYTSNCAMAYRSYGWRWQAKVCSLMEWKYSFVCQYPFRDGMPCKDSDSQSEDLSIEAVIGIVIGAIVGFVLLSLLLCWLLCLLRSTLCDRLKARSRLRRRATSGRPSFSDASIATVSRPAASQARPVREALASTAIEAREANDLNEQLETSEQQQLLLLLRPGAPPGGVSSSSSRPPELNVTEAAVNDVELKPLRLQPQKRSGKIRNDGGTSLGSGDGTALHGDGAADGGSPRLERAVSIEDNVLAANADVPYEKEQFTRSLQHLDEA